MKTKELRVTDILLDAGNYRTGKQDDQRKAIKALIEEQKGKLVVLARNIIENGLSPLETVMVYAVPGEKNRYVVIEGNRRMAMQPELAAETTWHKAFQKVHKLGGWPVLSASHSRGCPVLVSAFFAETGRGI